MTTLWIRVVVAIVVLIATVGGSTVQGWGAQGHRVVAMVATHYLTPVARRNVGWLLEERTLSDVAVWADDYVADNGQTVLWHFVDIPPEATGYNRDRDCPRQSRAAEGTRADRWRDCAIDRILYNQAQVGNAALDRVDRATALKFLVHLIGDLHQPFHALSKARGGLDTPVVAFGSPTCAYSDGASYTCHLHGVWDTSLVAHRRLSDQQYADELLQQIARYRWDTRAIEQPAAWALESHALARKAFLPARGEVDEAYYRMHVAALDERIALAGLRLAAILNQVLSTSPTFNGR